MWGFGEEDIRRQLRALWPHLRHASEDKSQRIAGYHRLLTADRLEAADRSQGRYLFQKACATCHRLFGQGGTTGPDLTGAQRDNVAYLLSNIVDPSAQLAEDYRMWVLVLADGRVVNGVIAERAEQTVTLQTSNERLVVDRSDIDELNQTELSIMPLGLLDALSDQQVCDLIAYLMSPQQVALGEPDF
jgi:putative heme-binding domain-containing protein